MSELSENVSEDVKLKESSNPVTTILVVVFGFLILAISVNVGLWWWAQRNAPPKPPKKMSAKRLKREKLKMGITAPGD